MRDSASSARGVSGANKSGSCCGPWLPLNFSSGLQQIVGDQQSRTQIIAAKNKRIRKPDTPSEMPTLALTGSLFRVYNMFPKEVLF